jgi:hypothetical protein
MTEEIKNIDQQIAELNKKKQELLKQGKEVFEAKKFWSGFFGLFSPVGWAKDIIGLLNVRKLVLYALILGSVAVYFYVQGKGETPIRTNINYEEELNINLNGEYLHKPKFSNDIYIKDTETGKIIKQLKAKDIQGLKKKLSPIGFELQPIFMGGIGIGESGVEGEVGAGVSFFRYWKMQLEAFLTNHGIYVGTSYSITDNSGAGIGVGKGYRGDDRIILYYRFNF